MPSEYFFHIYVIITIVQSIFRKKVLSKKALQLKCFLFFYYGPQFLSSSIQAFPLIVAGLVQEQYDSWEIAHRELTHWTVRTLHFRIIHPVPPQSSVHPDHAHVLQEYVGDHDPEELPIVLQTQLVPVHPKALLFPSQVGGGVNDGTVAIRLSTYHFVAAFALRVGVARFMIL